MANEHDETATKTVPPSELPAILDAMFARLQTLRSDSPQEAFDAFGAFFAPGCLTTLRSTREPPLHGRDTLITDLRELLASWHIVQRRVVSQAVDESNRTVLCAMEYKLDVMGDTLDPFHETATATFSEQGLVEKLLLYSCRSPVVFVMQRHTGLEPYHEVEVAKDYKDVYHIVEGGCCTD